MSHVQRFRLTALPEPPPPPHHKVETDERGPRPAPPWSSCASSVKVGRGGKKRKRNLKQYKGPSSGALHGCKRSPRAVRRSLQNQHQATGLPTHTHTQTFRGGKTTSDRQFPLTGCFSFPLQAEQGPVCGQPLATAHSEPRPSGPLDRHRAQTSAEVTSGAPDLSSAHPAPHYPCCSI